MAYSHLQVHSTVIAGEDSKIGNKNYFDFTTVHEHCLQHSIHPSSIAYTSPVAWSASLCAMPRADLRAVGLAVSDSHA